MKILVDKLALVSVVFMLFLGAASLALADELSGTIDGEKKTWEIVEIPNDSLVSYTEMGPGLQTFSIRGVNEERSPIKGGLTIGFIVINGSPSTPSVTYHHTNRMFPHYGNLQGGQLEIDTLEIEGDTARIVGSIKGQLQYLETMNSGSVEGEDIPVNLNFNVEAMKK